MSFDRQAARALFNNAPPATPDRTQRRTVQSAPEAKAVRAKAAVADAEAANVLNPGLDEEGGLYARLNRPPKRSKASVVLPVLVGVGALAGIAVIVLAQSNKADTAAAPVAAAQTPAAMPAAMTPAAPVAAATPAPAEPVAAPPPPTPAAKASAPRVAATVRPSRPAARTTSRPAPSPETTSATAPTAVNPPATTSQAAPSQPAPIVLPPPLPTPDPAATPQ